MSKEVAISVKGLSKAYRLGSLDKKEETLAKSIIKTLTYPFRAYKKLKDLTRFNKDEEDVLWALKDVDFEVMRGEAFGVIGKNGAGKSTLLKILSRITYPTHGEATIHGRVASLLEVGTGFNPELSGRENIFLNGTILGMTRKEVTEKYDEIVAFSGVEKFIDTPVKRYSSGMRVRLAFSVAAHLDPEILLIDEILSVGDAEFQKKCLGKMDDIAHSGRTILFVSHNMPMMQRLCKRSLLLQGGKKVEIGPTAEVVNKYMYGARGSHADRKWEPWEAGREGVLYLEKARVCNDKGEILSTVDITRPFNIEVDYYCEDPTNKPTVTLHVHNEAGDLLFVTADFNDREWLSQDDRKGHVHTQCQFPGNLFPEGRIFVTVFILTYSPEDYIVLENYALGFTVVDHFTSEGVRAGIANEWEGLVRPLIPWKVKKSDS